MFAKRGVQSTIELFSCGVPQGSILGPLQFLIHIYDLCLTSNLFEFILFADDANLIVTGGNLINNINYEMDILFNWFSANMLSTWKNKQEFISPTNKNIDCGYIYILVIN